MADWLLNFLSAHAVPIFGGAIVPLICLIISERRRKKAEAKEKKTEAELREIHRRSKGPYLQAIRLHVPEYHAEAGGKVGNKILRHGACVPFDVPGGIVLRLDVDNDQGASVKAPVAMLPEGWRLLLNYSGLKDERSTCTLCYPHEPKQGGVVVRFRLDFETLDGVKMHHVYETRHGFCELKRIDPA